MRAPAQTAGDARPNPGSREAVAAGCLCAVMDNNHGRFAPWPPDGWWVTEGCPIHSRASQPEAERASESELGS